MTVLVVNLSQARHLDQYLDHEQLVYLAPRLEDNDSKLEYNCSYNPSIFHEKKRIEKRTGLSIDLIITYVDLFGFYQFLPYFENVEVPILGILGDTHHSRKAIYMVHKYLQKTSITNIGLKCTKSQKRIFETLGYNVFCFKSYIVDPTFLEPTTNKKPYIALMGSNSPYHYRRSILVEKLKEQHIPLYEGRVSREEMFKVFNTSIASLNIPLNSDVNYRFHEIPASGGLLISEQLGTVADSNEALRPNRDYLSFSTIPELIDNCKKILSSNKLAKDISESSYHTLQESIANTKKEFLDFIIKIIKTPVSSKSNELIHIKDSTDIQLNRFDIVQANARKLLISPIYYQNPPFPTEWLNAFNTYNYSSD